MMEAKDGFARRPACGRTDDAVVAPLFVVTGASASGKTAILAPLARLLAGRCVTFDVDLLLDAAGALSGDQPMRWSAFRDAWLSMAHGVAQVGMPTVLLGPLIPEHLANLPARRWIGEIRYLVLDCPDEVRRRTDRGAPHMAEPRHRGTDQVRSLAAREHRRPRRHECWNATGRGDRRRGMGCRPPVVHTRPSPRDPNASTRRRRICVPVDRCLRQPTSSGRRSHCPAAG